MTFVRFRLWGIVYLLLGTGGLTLTSCQPAPAVVEASAVSSPLPRVEPAVATGLPVQKPTLTVTPPPTTTFTLPPTPTATIDSYGVYRIEHLTERSYGGGAIQVEETLAVNSYFTRTLITYPSDGLNIYGFMNIPRRGDPPYPVVIALHGYIEPDVYETIDYTTRYADGLARSDYLVLHPNLRGYPPSDSGDNLFRVGMAVDVLNLIALVREQAGKAGPLELADREHIGLWGHSMGGGIATRVMTISPDVDAVVLYAAMSGDERQNYEAINSWSFSIRGLDELQAPVKELTTISPVYYFERIQAAVSIHHGRDDELVPLNWSIDTCERLQALEKEVECTWHKNQPHTFYGDEDLVFEQQAIDFFDRELRGEE